MIVESQIRYQLARVLAKQLELKDFEDWFAQESWNVHQSGDPHLQELVGEIELRLAEYSSGHLSQAKLIDELRSFASIYCVPPTVTYGAHNDLKVHVIVPGEYQSQEVLKPVSIGTLSAGVSW